MSLHHSTRGRLGLAIGAFGASALLLAGCAGGGGGDSTDGGDASGEPLIVGTTDKVTSSTRPARTTTARSRCRPRCSRTW